MEVKSVYMDLVEGKRTSKGTWKLESEAFKKPIEIKIGFETTELNGFMTTCESLDKKIKDQNREIENLKIKDYDIDHGLKLTQDELLRQMNSNAFLGEEIQKNKSEISQLYKAIADAKTMIETQSGTILSMADKIKEIEKKLTKQPSVYSDKTFISGHERVGLTIIDVPSGDYLVIAKYVIGDSNEYVENQNDVIFEKVTVVDGHYIPMYQLVGGTELDTPTATIYRDLILIPC